MILTSSNWNSFAQYIAAPNEPDEYSPQALEKFMRAFEPFIVHMQNAKPQFHAINGIKIIDFRDAESRERYQRAWDNFCAAKAKLEAREGATGHSMGRQILTQLLIFRKAAEEEKVEDIVDEMYHAWLEGYAPVSSWNFKFPIAKAVKMLRDKYGIQRDQISIIWGGGNTTVSATKKKKLELKKKIESNEKLKELFQEIEMDEFDLGIANLQEAQTVEIDESLRLGPQSLIERQKEIDRFQSGKTEFCFFTLKAGGVGLSLHHGDEMCKRWNEQADGFADWKAMIDRMHEKNRPRPGKVRRHKDSGWAFVEDIAYIPIRPRRLFGAVTYSAIELVQMLGRCPRIASLSLTHQEIVFYKGTIEVRVAQIVSLKLKCLRKVVTQKESWESVILGGVDEKIEGGNLDIGEEQVKKIEYEGKHEEVDTFNDIEEDTNGEDV